MRVEWTLRLIIALLLEPKTANLCSVETVASITELNSCFESFFTTSSSTTLEEWEVNLPNEQEEEEMRALLANIYRMDSFENMGNVTLDNYKSLKDYVNVSIVQDHFCVIHELLPEETHRFQRMWGYAVIASKQWSKRPIHHSAAHFDSEGQVCAQAAALFERTRSRSLVVAGASRYAVKGDHRSECQRQFQIADAAHNSRTMFHWVNTVLKDLAEEDVRTGGIEDDHFFVQWHGMSETSCVASDVFISTGIANNSVYDKNIPANKLMLSFNRLAVDLRLEAKTPRQDVQCKLTAGTNVFGRYVNGVPGESVCNTTAQEKDVIGRFVHVEQKAASRDNISLWTSVIEDAFPVAHASQPIAATILTALGLLCTLLF